MKNITSVIAIAGLGLLLAACSDDSGASKLDNPNAKSGYYYADPTTRAMQDDDFENPGFPVVDYAMGLWDEPAGDSKKSCADCHGAPDDASGGPMGIPMAGVGSTYPRFDSETGKPINVELRINKCRTEQQKAKAIKYESDDMQGLTSVVKMQDRGKPVISTAGNEDDALHAAWKAGEAFYNQRRGKLNFSCANCHVDNEGNFARADILSQGQGNGFPTYRIKWGKMGSLHRRFIGCNKNVRAEPYARGSDEYLNLETYVTWRGRGLPVESPDVRK